MAEAESPGHIHPVPTKRNQLRYFFYEKHHTPGESRHGQWKVAEPVEFEVFDQADFHGISNDGGDLFGVRIDPSNGKKLIELGRRGEEVAKFPHPPEGMVWWHGYPCYYIQGVKRPPLSKAVLDKMFNARLITRLHQRRLGGGAHT